jgi:hypothetical protein
VVSADRFRLIADKIEADHTLFIALGEYQLITGDKSVLKTLKSTSELLRRSNNFHMPWHASPFHLSYLDS